MGCGPLYVSTVTPAPHLSGDGCVGWLHPDARAASALGARPLGGKTPLRESPAIMRPACQGHDARSRASGPLDHHTIRSLLGCFPCMHSLKSWKTLLHVVDIDATYITVSMQGRIAAARKTTLGATSTVLVIDDEP